MATDQPSATARTPTIEGLPGRHWNEFAYTAYAAICARKHKIVVPPIDRSVSDEELAMRLTLVSELAHLPPA